MERKLMWTSAVLPEGVINQVKQICLANNTDLKLSERFFNFPLHISLKRTFYVDDFLEVKKDIKQLLNKEDDLFLEGLYPFINSDMLWFRITNEETIIALHKQLDDMLQSKYSIPIDEFDKNYVPHITLFRDDDLNKIETMYKRIRNHIKFESIKVNKYALGTTLENNEFYIPEKRAL